MAVDVIDGINGIGTPSEIPKNSSYQTALRELKKNLTKNKLECQAIYIKKEKMQLTKIFLVALFGLFVTGCANGNFSPRNNPKINNEQGKIDEIKSNQNGVLAEIGKLKQDAQIMESQLKEIQNGLLNVNAMISRNENNGIQILQGDGSLIMVFCIGLFAIMLFYRNKYIAKEKSISIIAQEVSLFNNADLNEKILRAAMTKGEGKQMLKLLQNRSI